MLIVTLHQHMGPADPNWHFEVHSIFNSRSKQYNVHIEDPVWEDHVYSSPGFSTNLHCSFCYVFSMWNVRRFSGTPPDVSPGGYSYTVHPVLR
jgi:hypothetical protein